MKKYIIREFIGYKILADNKNYCWADTVSWLLGYKPFKDLFSGELKNLHCNEESGYYCNKCNPNLE